MLNDKDLRAEMESPGGDPQVTWLLEMVCEFATHNLYAAFDEPGTADYYAFMARDFADAGITLEEVDVIDDW